MNTVLPTLLMENAINSIHYVLNGDLKHTLFKFCFRYFHQYENCYVKNFVESCDVFKILKGKSPKPVTNNGNWYILCVIDLFSRFCVLKSLPNEEMTGIIDCLSENFNYWRFPSVLLSDNALKFCSHALHQFPNIYSIQKTTRYPTLHLVT